MLVLFLLAGVVMLADLISLFPRQEQVPMYRVFRSGDEWALAHGRHPFAAEVMLPDALDAPGDREFPALWFLLCNRPMPVHRADRETLDLLPHIGPTLADAIAGAAESGKLRNTTDLLAIPGIGPKTAARLEPLLQYPDENP
ncbi:MAG: ComEA family DNA-binding protein [Desulfobulbus sp.]